MYLLGHALARDKDNPAGVPGASFYGACAGHDVCYQTCSSMHTQQYCDDQLLANSLRACESIPVDQMAEKFGVTVSVRNECVATARDMHNALSRGVAGIASLSGRNAFNLRKQQYCQCC